MELYALFSNITLSKESMHNVNRIDPSTEQCDKLMLNKITPNLNTQLSLRYVTATTGVHLLTPTAQSL